eukprot:4776043-Alexandrium_andersonii.AAC.1
MEESVPARTASQCCTVHPSLAPGSVLPLRHAVTHPDLCLRMRPADALPKSAIHRVARLALDMTPQTSDIAAEEMHLFMDG